MTKDQVKHLMAANGLRASRFYFRTSPKNKNVVTVALKLPTRYRLYFTHQRPMAWTFNKSSAAHIREIIKQMRAVAAIDRTTAINETLYK